MCNRIKIYSAMTYCENRVNTGAEREWQTVRRVDEHVFWVGFFDGYP